jgi:hypothetical protein
MSRKVKPGLVNVRDRIVEVRRVRAGDLEPHPGNWRDHPDAQAEAMAGVMREVGDVGVLLAWHSERNGGKLTLIDGHLRRGIAPDHEYMVAVTDLSDAEADYVLVTHDPLSAMAQADAAALDALLASVQSQDASVTRMLEDLAKEAGVFHPAEELDAEPQIDKAEELRVKWGVEPGQLWQLGDHRLVCGDCTDAAVVARVMDIRCKSVVFDPEWDSAPQFDATPYAHVLAFTDGQRCGDVVRMFGAPAWVFTWDCVSCWYTPSRPLKRGKLCLWYGDVSDYQFDGAHYGDAGEQRDVFNTRGEYTFKPDPRGKHLADVFSAPITKLHAESEHSHSKPADWFRLLIGDCTTGDVYDAFAGSGTTIIACENLGRRCRAVEISPGYVAVALERWHQATGRTPERVP